jgi:hypothetical protein
MALMVSNVAPCTAFERSRNARMVVGETFTSAEYCRLQVLHVYRAILRDFS